MASSKQTRKESGLFWTERLIHSARALEFRVSMQEGAIKGLAGTVDELECR